MDQTQLALLYRMDPPKVHPADEIKSIKTYREACRVAWMQRRVRNMTKRMLAEQAGLYAPHVTCYLADDDRKRSLPAEKVNAFEWAVGNRIVSQWLAGEAQLTVLEEMQATRRAA